MTQDEYFNNLKRAQIVSRPDLHKPDESTHTPLELTIDGEGTGFFGQSLAEFDEIRNFLATSLGFFDRRSSNLSLTDLCHQVKVWSDHNFDPGRTGHIKSSIEPLLGMGEEVGEIAESVLSDPNYRRNFLHSMTIPAPTYDLYLEELGDHESTRAEYTYILSLVVISMLQHMGKIAHSNLKRRQKIRGGAEKHQATAINHLRKLLSAAQLYCRLEQINFHDLVLESEEHRTLLYVPEILDNLMEIERKDLIKDGCADLIVFLADFAQYEEIPLQEALEETWGQVSQRDFVKYPQTGLPPIGEQTNEDNVL